MPQQSSAQIAAELAAIAGAENVRVKVDSEIVSVSPSGVDQISAILRYSNANALSIHPIGANTKPWGRATKAGIELRTTNLNTVKEHVWQDMTATVEAGTTWSSLQSTLQQHGQYVALDPLWPEIATVGGVIATNDSGVLRLKYGSLRDLVIGMTIVLADGTIAKTGGKVVKNVAGYDLHKLMTGAFGTLGVIAEVTFRLHALPTNVEFFTVLGFEAEPLADLLLQFTASQFSLHALMLRIDHDSFRLDFSLATTPEIIAAQFDEMRKLAGRERTVSRSTPPPLYLREREFDTHNYTIKATMLPTAIGSVASMIKELSGTGVVQANGIMVASFYNATADTISKLRQHLESMGGSLTVLRQPADSNLSIWGTSPNTLPLMQKIKQHFDPNRILNPGHFLDGI